MRKRIVFYIIYLITLVVGWWGLLYVRYKHPIDISLDFVEGTVFSLIIIYQILFSWLFINATLIKKLLSTISFLLVTQITFTLVSLLVYGISYIAGWTEHFDLFTKDIQNPINIFLSLLVLVYSSATVAVWEIYMRKFGQKNKNNLT